MIESPQTARITTSWDDGHPLDFRIAGLLEKYGVAGTFYIPRSAPRHVMTPSQIRELSRRFEIGAHTLDHVYLNRVSDAVAVEQLTGSRRWIEDVTGQVCEVFCFPGGKYKARQLPLVRAAGFVGARTVELLSIRPPELKKDLFLIPTTIQAFPHRPSTYFRNAILRGRNISSLRVRDLFSARTWVELAERMLSLTTQGGGVFHVWGHSWEIDQHGQWENLERLLSSLARCVPKPRFMTNGALCQATLAPNASAACSSRAQEGH
jgi:peptidoglycan/xylan/chitin deacetylase (PgdA/CDA1 family)